MHRFSLHCVEGASSAVACGNEHLLFVAISGEKLETAVVEAGKLTGESSGRGAGGVGSSAGRGSGGRRLEAIDEEDGGVGGDGFAEVAHQQISDDELEEEETPRGFNNANAPGPHAGRFGNSNSQQGSGPQTAPRSRAATAAALRKSVPLQISAFSSFYRKAFKVSLLRFSKQAPIFEDGIIRKAELPIGFHPLGESLDEFIATGIETDYSLNSLNTNGNAANSILERAAGGGRENTRKSSNKKRKNGAPIIVRASLHAGPVMVLNFDARHLSSKGDLIVMMVRGGHDDVSRVAHIDANYNKMNHC
jgi:hypothetical protein